MRRSSQDNFYVHSMIYNNSTFFSSCSTTHDRYKLLPPSKGDNDDIFLSFFPRHALSSLLVFSKPSNPCPNDCTYCVKRQCKTPRTRPTTTTIQ